SLASREDVKNYFTTRDSYLDFAVTLFEYVSSDDTRYASYPSENKENLLKKLTGAVQNFSGEMKNTEENWLTALLEEPSSAKAPLDTCKTHASPIAQIASEILQVSAED